MKFDSDSWGAYSSYEYNTRAEKRAHRSGNGYSAENERNKARNKATRVARSRRNRKVNRKARQSKRRR